MSLSSEKVRRSISPAAPDGSRGRQQAKAQEGKQSPITSQAVLKSVQNW